MCTVTFENLDLTNNSSQVGLDPDSDCPYDCPLVLSGVVVALTITIMVFVFLFIVPR
jgi:hypothetical protein